MADRFPLILNTNANQIQEIASGDTLDLTGNNIKGVGVITATSFSGTISGTTGNSNPGTNSQGSSATNANLPPYYALIYIIKT